MACVYLKKKNLLGLLLKAQLNFVFPQRTDNEMNLRQGAYPVINNHLLQDWTEGELVLVRANNLYLLSGGILN